MRTRVAVSDYATEQPPPNADRSTGELFRVLGRVQRLVLAATGAPAGSAFEALITIDTAELNAHEASERAVAMTWSYNILGVDLAACGYQQCPPGTYERSMQSPIGIVVHEKRIRRADGSERIEVTASRPSVSNAA
jgi:hypothetical protein